MWPKADIELELAKETANDPQRTDARKSILDVMAKHLFYLCSLALVGCQYPRHENIFVVPDNFAGPLLVVLVEGSKQAFKRIEDRNKYEFPESGVICVASFDNFTKGWGITRAQYENGIAIAMADNSEFDEDRFGMINQQWSVTHITADGVETTLSDPEILFAIGSSDEMRLIKESWLTEEPHFRRHHCTDA